MFQTLLKKEIYLLALLLASVLPNFLHAQGILEDLNGNGVVEVVAFGDSITRGVGDFNSPGALVSNSVAQRTPSGEAGYPLRIETFLNIEVQNQGQPAERVSDDGLKRFGRLISNTRPDIVLISGGSNDAFSRTPSESVFHSFQGMINIAKALDVKPVLITAPPSCCSRGDLDPIISQYNSQLFRLAIINDLIVSDVYQAFRNHCPDISSCPLLNRFEGLHPNIAGYDVMGEVVTATLLNIDILSSGGPESLRGALGLPEGSIVTTNNAIQ